MLTLLVTLAMAAEPTVLLQEDEILPGLGAVTSISESGVSDAGAWFVRTNTPLAFHELVLRSDGVGLQQGDTVAEPVGAWVSYFEHMEMNGAGVMGHHVRLGGTAGSVVDNVALYVDGRLAVQKADAASYLGAVPGESVGSIDGFALNDAGDALVVGTLTDDPRDVGRPVLLGLHATPSGDFDQALVVEDGVQLAGTVGPIDGLGLRPRQLHLDAHGRALYVAHVDAPWTDDRAIVLGSQVIAVEGGASPLTGRTYDGLDNSVIALDDHGRVLFSASVTGDFSTDDVLVYDGQVVAREGQGHPDIGSHVLLGFEHLDLVLGNNGNTAWTLDWDDPDPDRGRGLFVNGRLALRVGDALPGYGVVDDIQIRTHALAMSPDGRWLTARVWIDGEAALVRFDLADRVEVADLSPGTTGVRNTMTAKHAVPGHRIAFVGAGTTGSTVVPCGGGSLTLSLGGSPVLIGTDDADARGEASTSFVLPSSMAGRSGVAQVVDLTACTAGPVTSFAF